jgi:hypothetical protein
MPSYSEPFVNDLNTLFRIALLITGSVELAEWALVQAIDGLSECEPNRALRGEAIAFTVARSSVGALGLARAAFGPASESALSLLHEDLRTILRLPADLRCCFVLRVLARYTNEQVGRLMNISTDDVQVLAEQAMVTLAELASERRLQSGAFGITSSLQHEQPVEGTT